MHTGTINAVHINKHTVHFFTHTHVHFLCILSHTETHTHAVIDVASVCGSPVNTRGWHRERRRRAESQRLVFCWLVIGSCHTNEGGPNSEIGGGGAAGWLKSPPQQQFLLSWAVSTVFLCLYLVLPVIWPAKRHSAWRTEGGWKGELSVGLVDRLVCFFTLSSAHHCDRAACSLWIYLCLRLWVTPGKARGNLRERRLRKPPPHLASHPSIYPSILCVCVCRWPLLFCK